MSHSFCPRCGYDLDKDRPIILNDFSMYGPGYPLCYQGKPLRLTYAEAQLCWSLLKAFPKFVKYDTLLDRMDSDGTSNNLNVFVCRIRNKFEEMGIPDPIATMRGSGYMWRASYEIPEEDEKLQAQA